MRVLVSAVPAIGHIVPLLDLAQSLQAAGHEVRFATNKELHRLVVAAGLHPVEAGMSAAEMRDERLRRWPETEGQPASRWATRMWAQIMAPSSLHDLLAIATDWRPHVVVHDEGDYAGPVAAAQSDVPWITHAWGSPLRPTSELVEPEETASSLWASNGLDVPTRVGSIAWAGQPLSSFLAARVPRTTVAVAGTPSTLDDEGELFRADAYIGFGTVPLFANALAELTAAVRGCTERYASRRHCAKPKICETN